MYFEEIFNLIYGVSIIYALLVALFFYKKGQRQKRRSVTLDYIRRWNQEYALIEPKSFSSRSSTRMKRMENYIVASIAEGRKPEGAQEHVATWNFYEELAIAIFFQEADEEMAKEFFFYSLLNTFKVSEKSIDLYREKSRNKALYVNFERLYGKWGFDREFVVVREILK